MTQPRSSVLGGARHTKIHTILQWIEKQFVPEISLEGGCCSLSPYRQGAGSSQLQYQTIPYFWRMYQSYIQALDVLVNRPFKDVLRESTDRQPSELSRTKGNKVPDLACAPQPDAAEENTKQIDGVTPATGPRRIILTKAVDDAWERMQEEHCCNIVQKGFRRQVASAPRIIAPRINLVL